MNQWHNCPNLAAFWYNIISALIYLFSLYSSGARYHTSKLNSNDPRYGQDWNENYLLLYLASILLSSLLWLLFVFASIFKTGSLANDYVEISTSCTIVGTSHISWSFSLVLKKIFSRFRYHLIPFNSVMHLCGAFLLLVPIPLIIKEEITHGIFYPENQALHLILTSHTPAIINFIVSAVSLTVRLPTVFLSVCPQISVLFSYILFIANTNILIRCVLHQLLPVMKISCDLVEMAVVDVVIFLLTINHYSILYEMARTRYLDKCSHTRLDILDQSSPKSAINTNSTRPNIIRLWPNILSTILLIVSITLSIEQYKISSGRMPLFYLDLVINLIHLLNWLTVILLFTFKTNWHFKLPQFPNKQSLLSRQTSLQLPNLNLKHVEPIYTCFQQLESVRSLSSELSKNQNHDFSSGSSSSSSHASERILSYKYIPSISKQLESPELNYDDLPSYMTGNKPCKNTLQEITEENTDQLGYFKSPNVSQRSSNIHSSDSGIGVSYRDHQAEYVRTIVTPDYAGTKFRPMTLQRHVEHDYDIDEEYDQSAINICSDV